MARILSTSKSLALLENVMRKYRKTFYARFGDIDLFFIDGKHWVTGKSLDQSSKAYGNNKTVFSRDLQNELKHAFSHDHPKFMKACSGSWAMEPGMTDKVFGPFKKASLLDRIISRNTSSQTLYHPWLFQYLSVFQQEKLDQFLNEFIKPKVKMFVGNVDQEIVERVIGKVDFYIKTPAQSSYDDIDSWYPEMIKILEDHKAAGNEIPVIILNTGQSSRVVAGRIWDNTKIGGHFLDFGSLFHAVAEINDRWWIKEVGDKVREHWPLEQRTKHYLLTRMNYACSDPEWFEKRLELFKRFTLPSIKAQTNQVFEWLWLMSPETPEDTIVDLYAMTAGLDCKVTIIRKEGVMAQWQSHFVKHINENTSRDDFDFVVTSRLDNDDVIHPEYMEWIRKHVHHGVELVDPTVLQYNSIDDNYFVGKYSKTASPFCSLIELLTEAPVKTVVACDHTHLVKTFGDRVVIQKPLALQVVHDDNLKNKIVGEQSSEPAGFVFDKPSHLQESDPETPGSPTPSSSDHTTNVFKTDKTKLLIPFIVGPDDSIELRFALRSIAKNLNDDVEVVLIGDKPDWAQNVTHIPQERISGKDYMVFMDTWNKVETLLEAEGVGSGFIYSYDDIFFLDKITRKDLYRRLALEDASNVDNLFEKTDASKKWQDVMLKTLEELKRKDLPLFNYETHLPRYYKVPEMRSLIEEYHPKDDNPFQMATLYFNHFTKSDPQLIGFDGGDIKFTPKIGMSVDDMNEQSANCKFMNLGPKAIHDVAIREFLEQMFPEQSIYEKKN